jgi:aspartate aminotransferase-like enzyme
MKDREFQGQEAMLRGIAESWNNLTSEDIQKVFRECMERLTWVIGNNGEYYPN